MKKLLVVLLVLVVLSPCYADILSPRVQISVDISKAEKRYTAQADGSVKLDYVLYDKAGKEVVIKTETTPLSVLNKQKANIDKKIAELDSKIIQEKIAALEAEKAVVEEKIAVVK